MGDDVVHFPRDPRTLLQHSALCPFLPGERGLVGQGPLGTLPGTQVVNRDSCRGEGDGDGETSG
jgi:hypothetical protein